MTGAALVVQAKAEALPLPDGSVGAVVCDPPYNLSFMGRSWDTVGGPQAFQTWCQQWATEALRVLKPGGWLLAFGGTRTWHRLACGIEDAGFEYRDTIAEFGPLAWLYGQGFPKGKGCLKPAWEPVLVARRPGSSVLQIDASRVGTTKDVPASPRQATDRIYGRYGAQTGAEGGHNPNLGRWPSNVVLTHGDCQPVGVRKVRGSNGVRGQRAEGQGWAGHRGERDRNSFSGTGQPVGYADPDGTETITAWACEPDCPVFLLDQQSGHLPGGGGPSKRPYLGSKDGSIYGKRGDGVMAGYPDQGGASRFMYTAKAGADERVTIDGEGHPTVKPLDLMRWLVRLITPPGGLILDMFGGSGTTGEAAMLEGFTCLVVDKDPASCAKAKVRAHPLVRRRVVTTGPLVGPEQGSLL